jgi:hypothetical protein
VNSRPSFFLPSKIAQEDTAFGFSLHPHPANRPPLAGFARRESSSERVTKLADRHSAGPDADEMPTCRYLPFLDEVAVGTIIADRPPHRSARALISACGSYLG